MNSGPGVAAPRFLRVEVSEEIGVSGLFLRPRRARACIVLAPGAGAGMDHAYLAGVANALAAVGIASLRFQFPYRQRGGRRPDPPELCHATVRAAVARARRLAPALPLFAGGKSFGGRMTFQAQAAVPLPEVRGLVFLGFPLHPANRPSTDRALHLRHVTVPMMFVQGTRDALADIGLVRSLRRRLGRRATLSVFEQADHGFRVPARSGQTAETLIARTAAAVRAWADPLIAADEPPGRRSLRKPP